MAGLVRNGTVNATLFDLANGFRSEFASPVHGPEILSVVHHRKYRFPSLSMASTRRRYLLSSEEKISWLG
jgi:hypothetical protein